MKEFDVYSTKGQKVDSVKLSAKIFDGKVNKTLIHNAVKMYLANQRIGAASTKNRSEVSGGGKKPWKQKGTGRARTGSIRSPLWKGGGVIFGPTKERNFKKKINKKVGRKALFMALSQKAKDNFIFVLDDLKLENYKTKLMVEMLKKLKIKGSTLLITPKTDAKMVKAGRNIPKFSTIEANKLNALDLLAVKNIILPKESLKTIKETFVK